MTLALLDIVTIAYLTTISGSYIKGGHQNYSAGKNRYGILYNSSASTKPQSTGFHNDFVLSRMIVHWYYFIKL